MTHWAAMGLAASLLAGCDGAGPESAPPTQISVRAVTIPASKLNGARVLGAHVLSSRAPEFGGFSGLSVRDGGIIAVTDAGWWLEARAIDDPSGLRPGAATFQPLRDRDGGTFNKRGGDAESLTWRNGALRVAFERDHRIMVMDASGQVTRALRDRGFERMSSNKGLEALATLPDGAILAVGEAHKQGAFPMFRVSGGKVTRAVLPAATRHFATGADVGPDGRLYLLLRDYTPVLGVSARIERFRIGANGFPDPSTRELIAAFSPSTGIDNMEGIAVWTDTASRTRIALISDDNFSLLQRTLLVDLVLEDDPV